MNETPLSMGGLQRKNKSIRTNDMLGPYINKLLILSFLIYCDNPFTNYTTQNHELHRSLMR